MIELEKIWDSYSDKEKSYLEEKVKVAFVAIENKKWKEYSKLRNNLIAIADFHFKTI